MLTAMKKLMTVLTYLALLAAHHHGHVWIDAAEHDTKHYRVARVAR